MNHNNQTIFNTVANHLLTQNEQSTENGTCRFFASNGNKCAIGCLIPIDRYTPDLEITEKITPSNSQFIKQQVENVFNLLKELGYTKENFPLIKRLRETHDLYQPHE